MNIKPKVYRIFAIGLFAVVLVYITLGFGVTEVYADASCQANYDACVANDNSAEYCASFYNYPSCLNDVPASSCQATHNNCTSGSGFNNFDDSNAWYWSCTNPNNGATDSCVEYKPPAPTCSATLDSAGFDDATLGDGQSTILRWVTSMSPAGCAEVRFYRFDGPYQSLQILDSNGAMSVTPQNFPATFTVIIANPFEADQVRYLTINKTPAQVPVVNGGWSDWSSKDNSCGYSGTQTRSCNNPSPSGGGADCVGPSTQDYTNPPCPPVICTNGPAGYTKCADEYGSCAPGGNISVAYGCSGTYNYKSATNNINCNNNVFEDPLVGTYKACFYQPIINGSCSATHYGCDSGTSANNAENSPNWTWSCVGSGVGHTDASCSVAIPEPTNFNVSCPAPGNAAGFSWTLPNGYNLSYFRLYDNTTHSNVSSWIPEDVSDNGPFVSVPTVAGHSYRAWIHTRLLSGAYSNAVSSDFACTPPVSGSITASNCTINSGDSTCNTNLSWSTSDYINTSSVTTPSSITVATANSSSGTLYPVTYGSTNFFLYNSGNQLGTTATAVASCANGTSWYGGACRPPVSVSVSAQTPYNTGINIFTNFSYTPSTNYGTTECRLLDNSQNALTGFQGSSPINYLSPNAGGSFGYYVQCRNTAYPNISSISNQIIVNTSCPGSTSANYSCPSGYTGTYTETTSYPAPSCSPSITNNSASQCISNNCSSNTTQTLSCSGWQTGAITQTRTKSPQPTCSLGDWVTTSDTCSCPAASPSTISQPNCSTAFHPNWTGMVTYGVSAGTAPSCTQSVNYSNEISDTCVSPTCVAPNIDYPLSKTEANCPAGWSGSVNYTRTKGVSPSCAIGDWTEVSDSCVSDTCSAATTQTLSCPAGQTGSITQTRTKSASPTCSLGNWTTTSNTCSSPTPTGFTASPSACGNNWLNLSWNAVSGATSYQVYRSGVLVYNSNGTSFSDIGLSLNTGYSYTITATVSGLASSPASTSGTVSNMCLPSAPASLSASAGSCGSGLINTSWASVSNISSYKLYRGATNIYSGLNTAYTDSVNNANTSYAYSVYAVNDAGQSSVTYTSPAGTVSPQICAPVIPGFTATAPTNSSCGNYYINVAWYPSSGATNYLIKRDGVTIYNGDGSGVWNGTNYAFSDVGLTPNSAPVYTLTVSNAGGSNTGGTTPSPSPVQQICAPSAPSLTASPSSCGTATNNLSWSAPSGATSYTLRRDGSIIYTGASNSYSDSGIGANISYNYTVTASNAGGTSSVGSASATSPQICSASTPTGFTASPSSCGNNWLNLSWNAVSGATSYQVYRSGVLVYNSNGTSFSDTGLSLNTGYSYTLTATNAGGVSAPASTSGTVSNMCAPGTPDTLTATPNSCGSGSINLSWSTVSGASSYRLYRGGSVIYTGANTSYTDSGLAADTSYAYTVYAVNNGGTSSGRTTSPVGTTSPDDCINYSLAVSGNLSVNKSNIAVTASNSVTRTKIAGTQSPIKVSVTGLPAGVTVSSVTNNPCTPTSGGCSSTINYSVAPSTVAGTYAITVTGSGVSAPSVTDTFNLTIVSRAIINVSSNNETTWTITQVGTDSGTSGSYGVNPGSGTAYIINAPTIEGFEGPVYYNDITGYSPSFVLYDGDTVNITVTYSPSFNYTLTNTPPDPVTRGGFTVYTQAVVKRALTANSGPTESVDFGLSGLPDGVTASISAQTCSPDCENVITFSVAPTTLAGVYPLTITGTPLDKTTKFSLEINNPSSITATCVVNPTNAVVGDTVTWEAQNISGGKPPYVSYVWSGVGVPTDPAPSTNPFSVVYSTADQKVATVTITDSIGNKGTCSAIGSAQISVKPNYKEQ